MLKAKVKSGTKNQILESSTDRKKISVDTATQGLYCVTSHLTKAEPNKLLQCCQNLLWAFFHYFSDVHGAVLIITTDEATAEFGQR